MPEAMIESANNSKPRWSREAVEALLALPFPELMFQAMQVHRAHFNPAAVQFLPCSRLKPVVVRRIAAIAHRRLRMKLALRPRS